ncbi:hypothetical protein EJB05_08584, partial [Eragrostis curvula]
MRPPPSASYRPTPMSLPPAAPPPEATPTTSPWHSPVPYLFGGLAAMLGLIALALLILACSYWKLNSLLGSGDDADTSTGASRDGGDGSKSPAVAAAASPAAFADLVAVVMAGEKTPTFLAAPIVRRRICEDDASAAVRAGEGSTETEEEKNGGKPGEGESGDNGSRGDRQTDRV